MHPWEIGFPASGQGPVDDGDQLAGTSQKTLGTGKTRIRCFLRVCPVPGSKKIEGTIQVTRERKINKPIYTLVSNDLSMGGMSFLKLVLSGF